MSSGDPRASRAALAAAEQKRRARRAADERDHVERTRLSLVLDGNEIGQVKPTAETEAKLRPDPIVRLVANETLTPEQGRAAVEIRRIYSVVVAGLLARTSNPEARGSRGFYGVAEMFALQHAQRYLPWVRYLGGRAAHEPASDGPLAGRAAKPAHGGRCPPALEIAFEIVIDHRSLRECDARRRWRSGTSVKLLVYALAVYADFAGWERGRDAIAAFEAWWGRRGGRRR